MYSMQLTGVPQPATQRPCMEQRSMLLGMPQLAPMRSLQRSATLAPQTGIFQCRRSSGRRHNHMCVMATLAENTFTVKGRLQEVFKYSADFSHIDHWDPGTTESENMESDRRAALKLGDKINMTTVLAGVKTPTVYMVTELDAPNKIVFFGVSRFHENIDTVTFSEGPSNGEVTVTYRSEISLIRWFKYFNIPLSPVLNLLAKEAVDGLEAKLKEKQSQLQEKSTVNA